MRSLWFRKVYVDPILSGEKVDTVRIKPVPGLKVGDLIGAHVGPRPRFATLRITAIEEIRLGDLDAKRRESVVSLYELDEELFGFYTTLQHISFVLVGE